MYYRHANHSVRWSYGASRVNSFYARVSKDGDTRIWSPTDWLKRYDAISMDPSKSFWRSQYIPPSAFDALSVILLSDPVIVSEVCLCLMKLLNTVLLSVKLCMYLMASTWLLCDDCNIQAPVLGLFWDHVVWIKGIFWSWVVNLRLLPQYFILQSAEHCFTYTRLSCGALTGSKDYAFRHTFICIYTC